MRRDASLHEEARLEALFRYAVLDTPPEQVFDDLVLMASRTCGTPISFLSFIDHTRQWFKAKIGLPDRQEMRRESSFCNLAILGKEPLIITDAQHDQRFADNPLAASSLGIRFYGGVPLVTPDGYSIGTLSVMSHLPRKITPGQIENLQLLARQVIFHLEARRVQSGIEKQEQPATFSDSRDNAYRIFFETNPHPMWIYDIDSLAFLDVNNAAVRHYGYSRAEFLQMTIKHIRPPADVPLLLKSLSETRLQLQNAGIWRHQKSDGTLIDVEILFHDWPYKGKRARVVLINDITERLRAQEALQQAHDELEIRVDERTRELTESNNALQKEIAQRSLTEKRLTKLNQCFLTFGTDPMVNINQLVVTSAATATS